MPIAVTAINATDTTTETAPSDADKASCSLSDEFEVMSFAYNNGSYTITWSVSGDGQNRLPFHKIVARKTMVFITMRRFHN